MTWTMRSAGLGRVTGEGLEAVSGTRGDARVRVAGGMRSQDERLTPMVGAAPGVVASRLAMCRGEPIDFCPLEAP